jgi:hypothetical protein
MSKPSIAPLRMPIVRTAAGSEMAKPPGGAR